MKRIIEPPQGLIDTLIKTAKASTCCRSKCGSLVVRLSEQYSGRYYIDGYGWNSMPLDQVGECFKDGLPAGFKSDRTCCVHAEQRAIMDGLNRGENAGFQLRGSSIFFIRLGENNEPLHAEAPYCTICSKMALDVGIKEFVLWHKEGWTAYDTKYYNELSFQYNGL